MLFLVLLVAGTILTHQWMPICIIISLCTILYLLGNYRLCYSLMRRVIRKEKCKSSFTQDIEHIPYLYQGFFFENYMEEAPIMEQDPDLWIEFYQPLKKKRFWIFWQINRSLLLIYCMFLLMYISMHISRFVEL